MILDHFDIVKANLPFNPYLPYYFRQDLPFSPHRLIHAFTRSVMALFLLAFTSAVALLSSHLLCIYSNYKQACRIGLPIIVTPINVLNPVWILTQQWFVP